MRHQILILCAIVGMASPAMAENWPAWRVAEGTGISREN
jgi:hypothetical protein